MLATTGPLPTGPGWAYEFKWDGVRALATLRDGTLRLHARSGAEITLAYPELAPLASRVRDAVLEGDVVGVPAGGALARLDQARGGGEGGVRHRRVPAGCAGARRAADRRTWAGRAALPGPGRGRDLRRQRAPPARRAEAARRADVALRRAARA